MSASATQGGHKERKKEERKKPQGKNGLPYSIRRP